jgi:hypothetical protein
MLSTSCLQVVYNVSTIGSSNENPRIGKKNIKSCPNNRFRNPYNNISRTNYTICLHHGTLVHICFRRESMTSFTCSRKKKSQRHKTYSQICPKPLRQPGNNKKYASVCAHCCTHVCTHIYIYMYAHTTICANPLHKSWMFQTETN